MKKLTVPIIIAALVVAAAAVVLLARRDDALLFKNEAAIIDARAAHSGTVNVSYTGGAEVRIKVQVTPQGGATQNYNLSNTGETDTFPLHSGGGRYIVRVCEQVDGEDYKVVHYASFDANCGEFVPFLAQNQYVNWTGGSTAVQAAHALSRQSINDAETASLCFDFVTSAIDYDATMDAPSGYLPDHERALTDGSGICLDYAAALCVMLRSQKIPARLIVGWAGETYHAWVDAYIGGEWQLFDPTFVANANGDQKILDFVQNRDNYTVRYVY